MKSIAFVILLGLSLLAPGRAQTLPAGPYGFTANLGPIHLDGRYPIMLADLPEGVADLTTTASGGVRGTVDLLGSGPIPVTGSVAVRKTTVRLLLKGRSTAGAFSANCVLSGSHFTGAIKFRGRRVRASIDVLGVGAIQAGYIVNLSVNARGRIDGTGTVTVGRDSVPVAVRGTSSARRVSLTIKGGKTVWQGGGAPPALDSFTVDWSARAFGAAVKGRALVISPLPAP
jgi:hypothetical protein